MTALAQKVTAKGVDLPRFRYLDDYTRFIEQMEEELRDTEQVVQQQQKLLSSLNKDKESMNLARFCSAAFTFDVTPSDKKALNRVQKQMKTAIDTTHTKIAIQNLGKLKTQYALAEDLYEKHKTVEAMETQLSLQFPDRRGEAFKAAQASLAALKGKVAAQLKIVFGYLNEVAAKHVPKEFVNYMDLVGKTVSDHVKFDSSELFLYVSVDKDGTLLFTYYLMLQNAVNDEGRVTPQLYISLQWKLGKGGENKVTVQLNHEYEVPNKLAHSGGVDVHTVGDAVKAIGKLLDLQDFSSALGIVPLTLQLKVDPQNLNTHMFSARDMIQSISVDEHYLNFTLRKEANTKEIIGQIAQQLYTDIKGLLKSKAEIFMKPEKKGSATVLSFHIVKKAQAGEFSAHDAEFLRDRFGLTDSAMKKIVNILNTQ